tara:strand:- start:3799 stop:6642 length:2844 start_codon:yes stop_codon:yes gene_type:complete
MSSLSLLKDPLKTVFSITGERNKSVEGFYTNVSNPRQEVLDNVEPTTKKVYENRKELEKKRSIRQKIIRLNTIAKQINDFVANYNFTSDGILRRAAERNPNDVKMSNVMINKRYSDYEAKNHLRARPIYGGRSLTEVAKSTYWSFPIKHSRISLQTNTKYDKWGGVKVLLNKYPAKHGKIDSDEGVGVKNSVIYHGPQLSLQDATTLAAQRGYKYFAMTKTIRDGKTYKSVVLASDNINDLRRNGSIWSNRRERTYHNLGSGNNRYSIVIKEGDTNGMYFYKDREISIDNIIKYGNDMNLKFIGWWGDKGSGDVGRTRSGDANQRAFDFYGGEKTLWQAAAWAKRSQMKWIGTQWDRKVRGDKNVCNHGIGQIFGSRNTPGALSRIRAHGTRGGSTITPAEGNTVSYRRPVTQRRCDPVRTRKVCRNVPGPTRRSRYCRRSVPLFGGRRICVSYGTRVTRSSRRVCRNVRSGGGCRTVTTGYRTGSSWSSCSVPPYAKNKPIKIGGGWTNACYEVLKDNELVNFIPTYRTHARSYSYPVIYSQRVMWPVSGDFLHGYINRFRVKFHAKYGVEASRKGYMYGFYYDGLNLNAVTTRSYVETTPRLYDNVIFEPKDRAGYGRQYSHTVYRIGEMTPAGNTIHMRENRDGQTFYVDENRVGGNVDSSFEKGNFFQYNRIQKKASDYFNNPESSTLKNRKKLANNFMTTDRCRRICNQYKAGCKAFTFYQKKPTFNLPGVDDGTPLPTCEIKDQNPTIYEGSIPGIVNDNEDAVTYEKLPKIGNHWTCTDRVVTAPDSFIERKGGNDRYHKQKNDGTEIDVIKISKNVKSSNACGEYARYLKEMSNMDYLQSAIGNRVEEYMSLTQELKSYNLDMNKLTKGSIPTIDDAVAKYEKIINQIAEYRNTGDFRLDKEKTTNVEVSRKSDNYTYFSWLIVTAIIIIVTIITLYEL